MKINDLTVENLKKYQHTLRACLNPNQHVTWNAEKADSILTLAIERLSYEISDEDEKHAQEERVKNQ